MKTIEFTAAKGGVGTTTSACMYALALAGRRIQTHLLADPAGDDIYATTGLPPGADRWGSHLTLGLEVPEGTEVLVVDGRAHPDHRPVDHAYTCVTNEYVALTCTMRSSAVRGKELIVLRKPGRSLSARDVSDCFDQPVALAWDETPAVARAIDAGLLAAGIQTKALQTAMSLWLTLTKRDIVRTIQGVQD